MMSAKNTLGPISVAACLLVIAVIAVANAQPVDKEKMFNEMESPDDEGSIDAAVANYLFAKQFVNRLRAQGDISDFQRKRSYWKQCAFNAVSCFGQKREGGRGRNLVPRQRNGRWDFLVSLFSFRK